MRTITLVALVAVSLVVPASQSQAVPPTFLVLRRAEAPGRQHMPGKPPAYIQPTPAYGYAYGWFGASPRQHSARHFGYYRNYTEWSAR